MWISVPTNVTSITNVIDSGSMRSPAETSKLPAGTQLNRCCWTSRSPSDRPSIETVMIVPITKLAAEAKTPSAWPQESDLRPATISNPALISGIAMSSQLKEKAPSAAAYCGAAAKREVAVTWSLSSVLQQVGIVDRGRTACTENSNNNRKPHHNFCGGYHHDEERHDLPIKVAVHARKRHKSQVCGVQHEFYAHKDDNRVTSN